MAGGVAAPFVAAFAAPLGAWPLDPRESGHRPVAANSATGQVPAVFTRNGLALDGYDAVGYFSDGRPIKGAPGHRLKWRGAIWRFASAENCLQFEMNPRAYAPQFGGYCAYTVANGVPMKAEPDLWTIYQGRLYLNFDARIQALWRRDMDGYIAMARDTWRQLEKT